MNPIALLLRFLGDLAVSATSRLVEAARDSLKPPPPTDYPGTRPQLKKPPPPPIGNSGAREYLRGANDEAYRMAERDRLRASTDELARKAALDDTEPEEPTQ